MKGGGGGGGGGKHKKNSQPLGIQFGLKIW